ncbi:MAG: ABC transporter, ATPase subunit [Candidatus Daviesbacteria bacterium GW2011_GWA2_38_24]|uniref:ABC transporter, ATPase subunit n=1 Tax=Candidatus Daviesbacteria bacterium GW2011_GWA2_38_24 TaxID=1618422 RepID=A0A0G0MQ64_9BACT|nr:MAG: ABC transporter, ATPase subunit [Candidatus Daviesbacteria bacterium GW2011_GWA2_38_24]KKQ80938.1 MAG: ABC transporter, ATPase subunit [Candidatus Daviesbacteria bacterium GW2011_GWA1_38_7]OGE22874.1 MAG: ABC transporter ATP-binding protein [Candidatus Daviesbacteria bacterium RIFCSPHIGHO2_01_FULL_38_8]
MKPLIKVTKLTKVYGKNTVVDSISFEAYKGEILGLLGPNGAGKTTTIQMILGLIEPTKGKVRIFGKDMKTHREEILSKVNFSSAYVSLPTNLKVWENLYTFARLYDVKDYKKRVRDLVDFFDINPIVNKLYGQLSSGQATRVNLVKALLNSPKLLFLDEPTASLDPDIADRVRRYLKSIQKKEEITVIYTSHNMAEIDELCNRVIFINEGKLVTEGSPKKLVKQFGLRDLNEVFIKIAREES